MIIRFLYQSLSNRTSFVLPRITLISSNITNLKIIYTNFFSAIGRFVEHMTSQFVLFCGIRGCFLFSPLSRKSYFFIWKRKNRNPKIKKKNQFIVIDYKR